MDQADAMELKPKRTEDDAVNVKTITDREEASAHPLSEKAACADA